MTFVKKLEDLDHPLLGPTLKGLKLWRIWQPLRSSSVFFHSFTHVFGTLFVVSQYAELWLIRDNLQLALRNLSVTMLSTICMVKAISFIYWQKDWKSLIEYVSELEKQQISKKDHITASIIREYTKYSRNITYFYWFLVTVTVFTVILAPLFGFISSAEHRYMIINGSAPYPEILNSWLPFDRTRGFGYWISVLEHSAICVYGGGVVANFDSNAVVIMCFFNGQLKLLSKNCARILEEKNDTDGYDEAINRIRECHDHHVGLVKSKSMIENSKAISKKWVKRNFSCNHFLLCDFLALDFFGFGLYRLFRFATIFNSLLSPVMFVYVIICSLMICASAVQLTMEGTGTMQRIWIAEYLLALIAQLFLYCWHSNEVLNMSNKVEDGVYLCAWWSQNVRMRRSMLLLGGQLRKSIVFTAGPFTKLTVATFVAILKGSYSYYTLLSQKED